MGSRGAVGASAWEWGAEQDRQQGLSFLSRWEMGAGVREVSAVDGPGPVAAAALLAPGS